MIRGPLIEKGVGSSKQFRWRGGDVSRLEGFSDAVFGFSLTLLVVSTEVPKTFDGLLQTLREFPVFAFCFAALCFVWYRHYLFFRRYGIQDGYTVFLNAVLLFLVVFYVYPLKFFSTLALAVGARKPLIEAGQVSLLFTIYGLGLTAVFLIFTLLYLHAYRRRRDLALNPLEVVDTVESILGNIGMMIIGPAAIAIIYTTHNATLAGLSFCLMGVSETVIGTIMGTRRRRLEAQMDSEAIAVQTDDNEPTKVRIADER